MKSADWATCLLYDVMPIDRPPMNATGLAGPAGSVVTAHLPFSFGLDAWMVLPIQSRLPQSMLNGFLTPAALSLVMSAVSSSHVLGGVTFAFFSRSVR